MLDITTWAQVRGHEVFRDHATPDLYWVLPGTLELLNNNAGEAQLSLILHRGGNAPSGGMLTATFVVATSPEQRTLIADDLRRITGRAVEVRTVELEEVEVFTGGESPTSVGRGRVSPQGHLAAMTPISAEAATEAEAALAAGHGLEAWAQFQVAGHRPGVEGQMTVDHGRAAALWSSGEARLDALAVRAGFQQMLEQGIVRLQAADAFERVTDAARAWVADLFLDPVGTGQWRPKAPDAEAGGTVTYDLGQGAPFTLRRAVNGDLAALAGAVPETPEDAPSVRVDVDANEFFRETNLQLEVMGDFEAHAVHTLIVEVRAGDEQRSELFREPSSKTVRFRGAAQLEMRTRALLRSEGQTIGHTRGELASPWRPMNDEIAMVMIDAVAPLWPVELSTAVDWSVYHRVEVDARYSDAANELDGRTTIMLTADAPRSTLSVRPRDASVDEVVLEARFIKPGGHAERRFTVKAPGAVVIER
ncbi:MAG: hypothetical protein AAF799_24745 [Myxococcota bacterium]